jgi:hypothetical protein
MGHAYRARLGHSASAGSGSGSIPGSAPPCEGRDDIAVACALPLCEVLCMDVAEVSHKEYRRAAQVLTALSSVAPARVGGECNKKPHTSAEVKCNIYSAWTARDSALGKTLAKEPAALTRTRMR